MRGAEQPLRWLCAREIQKSIQASVKQLLEDKIIAAGLGPRQSGGNGYYQITDRSITGGDGRTEFLFAGLRSNPDNVKSMEGLDGAWVEEANNVSKRSIELLTPTLRKPNSEIWFSWNRRMTSDPVDNMFLGGEPPPDSIVRQVNWRDNPWFPDVLKTELEWDKGRDYDKYLHVWEGSPVIRSEARVFNNWRVEDIDEMLPGDCIPRLGADWGFSIDPTVLIECYVFDRILYFRREVWKIRAEIDETPALFAGSDTREPPRWTNLHGHSGLETVRKGFQIVADSARPETISYMKKRNFKIIAAKKGPGSIQDGIEFMKTYDIVVHPDCPHVTDELTFYSFKVDPLTDEVLPVLEDKKNHTIDSCRYAVENLRRNVGGGGAGGLPIAVEG